MDCRVGSHSFRAQKNCQSPTIDLLFENSVYIISFYRHVVDALKDFLVPTQEVSKEKFANKHLRDSHGIKFMLPN